MSKFSLNRLRGLPDAVTVERPRMFCGEGDCCGLTFNAADLDVAAKALDIVDGLDVLAGRQRDNRRAAAAVLAAVASAAEEAENACRGVRP